jgi:hypothetical protein
MRFFGPKVGCAAGVVCILAVSSAEANIVFCNEFPAEVWVAIAYQQEDGSWLSRGWLSVETGKCYPFDTAIHVKTFYFRGESKPYHHQRSAWGSGKDFAVWENNNFQYYNADQRVLNSTLKSFTKGPEAKGDSISATVTFPAEGGTLITGPSDAPATDYYVSKDVATQRCTVVDTKPDGKTAVTVGASSFRTRAEAFMAAAQDGSCK